jgi:hypothetical protein
MPSLSLMQILTCLRHSGEACDELDVAEAISSQDTRLKQIFNITITTIFFWAFFMNVSSIIRERILQCDRRGVNNGATTINPDNMRVTDR